MGSRKSNRARRAALSAWELSECSGNTEKCRSRSDWFRYGPGAVPPKRPRRARHASDELHVLQIMACCVKASKMDKTGCRPGGPPRNMKRNEKKGRAGISFGQGGRTGARGWYRLVRIPGTAPTIRRTARRPADEPPPVATRSRLMGFCAAPGKRDPSICLKIKDELFILLNIINNFYENKRPG